MGCRRVGDEGLEVTVSCNGIIDLEMKGVHRITARTINAVSRSLKNLQTLDIRDCHLVHESAIGESESQSTSHKFAII